MKPLIPNANGCKMCGEATQGGSRGLCQKHYRRFKTKLEAFETVDEAIAFEQKCLDEGWIVPKSKGGRPKDKDAFDIIAEQVIAEGNASIDAAIKAHAKKKSSKSTTKRTTKKRGS